METLKEAKTQEAKEAEIHELPSEGPEPSDQAAEAFHLNSSEAADPSGKFQLGQNDSSSTEQHKPAPELSFLPEIQVQSDDSPSGFTPHAALIVSHQIMGDFSGQIGIGVKPTRGTAEKAATIEITLISHHNSLCGGSVKTQTTVTHKRRDDSALNFILVHTARELSGSVNMPVHMWSLYRVSAQELRSPPPGACILTVAPASEPSHSGTQFHHAALLPSTRPKDPAATPRPAPAVLDTLPYIISSQDFLLSRIRVLMAEVDTALDTAACNAFSVLQSSNLGPLAGIIPSMPSVRELFGLDPTTASQNRRHATSPDGPGALEILPPNRLLRHANPPESQGLFGAPLAAQNIHARADDNNDANDDEEAIDDRWFPRPLYPHAVWHTRHLPRPIVPDRRNLVTRATGHSSDATSLPVPTELFHPSFDFEPPNSDHANPFTTAWQTREVPPPAFTPQAALPVSRLPPMLTRHEDAMEIDKVLSCDRPKF
jgi:hypothetical protein